MATPEKKSWATGRSSVFKSTEFRLEQPHEPNEIPESAEAESIYTRAERYDRYNVDEDADAHEKFEIQSHSKRMFTPAQDSKMQRTAYTEDKGTAEFASQTSKPEGKNDFEKQFESFGVQSQPFLQTVEDEKSKRLKPGKSTTKFKTYKMSLGKKVKPRKTRVSWWIWNFFILFHKLIPKLLLEKWSEHHKNSSGHGKLMLITKYSNVIVNIGWREPSPVPQVWRGSPEKTVYSSFRQILSQTVHYGQRWLLLWDERWSLWDSPQKHFQRLQQ